MHRGHFKMYGRHSATGCCNMSKMHKVGCTGDFSASERQELINAGFDPDKVLGGHLSESELDELVSMGFDRNFLAAKEVQAISAGTGPTDILTALVKTGASIVPDVLKITNAVVKNVNSQNNNPTGIAALQGQIANVSSQLPFVTQQNTSLQQQAEQSRAIALNAQRLAAAQQSAFSSSSDKVFTKKNIAIGAAILGGTAILAIAMRR